MGDLKSVVLHKMEVNHVKSTFPMSLGARITGVDDCTFSSTGESFSAIVLPNAETSRITDLQSDDVSLAYEVRYRLLPCSAMSCNACHLADQHPRLAVCQEVSRLHFLESG